MMAEPRKKLSRKPLFSQVRDLLLERVTTGEWAPGQTLPNESDLARELGVSHGTLRRALERLEAERIISRRQGRGTFVNDQASDELAYRFHKIRTVSGQRPPCIMKEAEFATGPADARESSRLRLLDAENVVRVERLRLSDKTPYMLEQCFLPATLFPGLRDPTYHIGVLAASQGIILSRAEERVCPRLASGIVAKKLGIADGTPILELDRILYSNEGIPVEWRFARCHLGDGHYRADIE